MAAERVERLERDPSHQILLSDKFEAIDMLSKP